jgi:multicomponent Na+:H+ antiporter subunit G
MFSGLVFCFIGALGLLKLPDLFSRMHAAGIIDTLGVGLIISGLFIQTGFTLVFAKLLMVLVFIFFASPTATHALARAAINGRVLPNVKNSDVPVPVDNNLISGETQN